jgi:hypothetical protein
MKKVLCLAFLGLSLLLTGCAAPQVGDPAVDAGDQAVGSFLDDLGRFTANDLEVAMKLTGDRDLDGQVDPDVVNGDPVALQCYAYLHGKVTTDGGGETITVAGVVSAFQSARNVKRRIGTGVSDEFHLACGPLINDVRASALGLVGRLTSAGVLPF